MFYKLVMWSFQLAVIIAICGLAGCRLLTIG
jgi:hypothetical protein